jgi:hypothetical protein
MPGETGVTVVRMLVCFFYFAREAAGAASARHSLRPLISQGQEFKAKLGRNARRDRGVVSGRRGEERRVHHSSTSEGGSDEAIVEGS